MKTSTVALVAVSAAAFDQLTKWWAIEALHYGPLPAEAGAIRTRRLVISETWFDLQLAGNEGAAWSLFAGLDERHRLPLLLGVSAIAIVMIAALVWRSRPEQRMLRLSLATILGGALGNLVDRVRLGYVVDFLHGFHGDQHWPTFNLADVAIALGFACLAIEMVRDRPRIDQARLR